MLILPHKVETPATGMFLRMCAVKATPRATPCHGDIVSTYNEEPEEGCFFQPKYNTQIYNNSTLYPVPS